MLSALVLALAACMSVARDVLSAETLDATRALALPAWLDHLTRRTAVAYPSHVALGSLLERLGLSPAATAVQWMKAAAHARSDAELESAARGISAALERDGDSRALATVCKLRDLGDERQVRAVMRSRAPCDRWTPAVSFEATASPSEARAGTPVRITAFVTSVADFAGLVDVELHAASGGRVAQWVFPDQKLDAGRRYEYVIVWDVPENLPAGRYQVKLGVFNRDWSALHGWKNLAAMVTVIP